MRPAAATAVLTLVAAGAATPAHADDGSFLQQIECGSSGGAGCSILLRWAQTQDGRSGSDGSGDSGDPAASGGSGGSTGDVDWSAIDWDAIDWSQVDWDAIDWDEIDYEGEEDGDEPPTDPVTLIQESMDSFELPQPTIETSPGSGSLVLVNTPVWLWLESQEWEAAEASAEVPGWSLTVTATPTFTVWDLGDGTRVRCEGPGTPFDPAVHDPAEASPDCGHVYTLPSDTQDDGTYTVTVEVGWDVGWELSDGDAGDEAGELDPVTTTSQVELQVVESQGLVTGTDPR